MEEGQELNAAGTIIKQRQERVKRLFQNYTNKVAAHPNVVTYTCNFCTGICAPAKMTTSYTVDEPEDTADNEKAVICFPCGHLHHWSCHKEHMQFNPASTRCVVCRNVVREHSANEKLSNIGLGQGDKSTLAPQALVVVSA